MQKKHRKTLLLVLLVLVFFAFALSPLYAEVLHGTCSVLQCGTCTKIATLQDALRRTVGSFGILLAVSMSVRLLAILQGKVLQNSSLENLVYLKIRMNN